MHFAIFSITVPMKYSHYTKPILKSLSPLPVPPREMIKPSQSVRQDAPPPIPPRRQSMESGKVEELLSAIPSQRCVKPGL